MVTSTSDVGVGDSQDGLSSILGIDPQDMTPPEPGASTEEPAASSDQQAASTVTPVNVPSGMTQEQIDEWKEGYNLLQEIRNDDGAMQALRDHYIKSRMIPDPQTTPPVQNSDNSEISTLREHVETLTNFIRAEATTRKVNEFAARTPDFEQYRQKMGELAKDMPQVTDLDKLYSIAKAMDGNSRPPSPDARPATPVQQAEGKPLNVPAEQTFDPQKRIIEAQSKVFGPNAKLDAAFDAALEIALSRHKTEGEQ